MCDFHLKKAPRLTLFQVINKFVYLFTYKIQEILFTVLVHQTFTQDLARFKRFILMYNNIKHV